MKETAQDSAERAHFLSRYIDEEIVKIGQKVVKQLESVKNHSSKLMEQFKKHLINHENMKKDMYNRFDIIDGHLPVYRSELYNIMEKSENRAMQKIKEIQASVESTMLTNFQVLDERVDKFSELVDSNMETLRKAVADNREVYIGIINKSNMSNEEKMNDLGDDIQKVGDSIYNIEAKLESLGGNNGEELVRLTR